MAKQLNVDMRFTADTSKARQAIAELQTSIQKLGYGAAGKDVVDPAKFQQASRAARELAMHLNNAFDTRTGNLDLSKLNASLKSSGTSLSQLTANFSSAGKVGQEAFMSLAKAVANADLPVLSVNRGLNNLLVTLKNTARFQISSSLIHGFVGGIQSAYGYAQDLNESLNNIRIVTGQSTEQMARFAKQANEAARGLSATTLDYTNASLIYYQQGLDDEAVAARTETTLKLANVSRQSAEEVSNQMTAIWNNFAEGSTNLEYYADVITALGAATASSSQEIAGGLEKFASVANTIGLSYEYAASALATIVATTRQSEDTVGTGLRTLFARFEGLSLGKTLDDGTTLNKYSKALESVGVNIKDQFGDLKSMNQILDELGSKWQTLSKEQQIALAQTVGGVRQYTNLVALMDNWDYFQQNVGVASGSAGTLQEQADTYAESWEAAQKRVKAAAESLFDTLINDDFFIQVNNIIETVLTGINKFMTGFGGVKNIIFSVLSFALSMVAGKIGPAVQGVVQNLQIMTGHADKVYAEVQKDFNQAVQQELATGKYEENPALKAELQTSQNILAVRTKLNLVNDKLSASEQMRAQLTIQGLELEGKHIQDLYVAQGKLEQEIEKATQLRARANENLTKAIAKQKEQVDKQKEQAESQVSDLEKKINDISQKIEGLNKQKEELDKTIRVTAGMSKGSIIQTSPGRELNPVRVSQAQEIQRNKLQSFDDIVKINEQIESAKAKIQVLMNTAEGKLQADAKAKVAELRKTLTETSNLTEEQKLKIQKQIDSIIQDNFGQKAKKQFDTLNTSIENSNNLLQTFNNLMSGQSLEDYNKKITETARIIKTELVEALTNGKDGNLKLVDTFKSIVTDSMSKITPTKDGLITDSQIAEATGKLELFKQNYDNFFKGLGTEAGKNISKITSVMQSALKKNDVEAYNKSLSQLKKAITTLNIPLDKAGKLLKILGANEEQVDKLTTAVKQRAEIQEKLTKATQEHTTAQKELNAALDHQKEIGKEDELPSNYEELKKKVEDADAEVQRLNGDLEKNRQEIENSQKSQSATVADFMPEHLVHLPEGIAAAAAGIGQVVSLINTVRSAVNTLSDSSASAGEKLIASLTAISMTVPAVIGVIKNYSTVLEALNLLQIKHNLTEQLVGETIDKTVAKRAAQIIVENKALFTKAALADETKKTAALALLEAAGIEKDTAVKILDKIATEGLAAAMKDLVASSGPLLPLLVALGILTTVVGAIIGYQDQLKKSRLEEAEATNKAAKAAREEAEAHQQLIDSYKEALDVWEETQDNKEELESAAKKVAEAYEIENAQLLIQAGLYEDVLNKAKEYAAFEASEAAKSAEKAYTAAEANYRTHAHTNGTNYWQNPNANIYRVGFEGGDYSSSDINKATGLAAQGYRQAVAEGKVNTDYISAVISTGDLVFKSAENTAAGFIAQYEAIEATRDAMRELAKEQNKDVTQVNGFIGMQAFLGDNLDYYNKLIEARDLLSEATLDEVFYSPEAADVNTLEDYNKVYNQYIQALQKAYDKNGIQQSYEDITKTVEAYMTQAYSDLAGLHEADILVETSDGENFETWFNSLGKEEQSVVLTLIAKAGGKVNINDLIEGLKEAEDLIGIEKLQAQQKTLNEMLTMAKEGKTSDEDWEKFYNESSESEVWSELGINSLYDLLVKTDEEKIEAITAYNNRVNNQIHRASQDIIGRYSPIFDQLNEQRDEIETEYIEASNNYFDANNALDTFKSTKRTISNSSGQQAEFTQEELLQAYQLYNKAKNGSGVDANTLTDLLRSKGLDSQYTWWGIFEQLLQNSGININQLQSEHTRLNRKLGTANENFLVAQGRKNSLDNEIEPIQSKLDEANIGDTNYELENFRQLKERINEEELKFDDISQYAGYLRKAAEAGDGVAESLQNQTQDSQELATKLTLLQRAVDDLHSNLGTYEDVLNGTNKGTKDYEKQLTSLQGIMEDLVSTADFQVDGSIFDGKFFEDNAELIKQAAEGDKDAIWELQKIAAEQIILKIDNQDAVSEFRTAIEGLESLIPEDLEIGTSIGEINGVEPYLASLQTLLDAGQLTADEVNAALGAIGFEPEITYVPISMVNESEIAANGGQDVEIGDDTVHISSQAFSRAQAKEMASIPVISTKATRSTGQAGGGAIKLPSGGSGGGGGGGGGGKTKSKEKKDPTDDKDRYHTITEKISDATNAYDELSKAEDRAFGKERVDAMKGMTDNLKLQIELQKQYLDEIRDYLVGDRAAVEALGATFDANGVITNYDALIDELVAKYNEGVDAFNAGSVDEDAFKEQYEEPFNKAKEAIDQYVETINLLQDEELNLIDLQNDLADELREIAAYKLELHIDLDEDELQYLDFLLEMLGDKAEDAADRLDLLGQQFNTNRDEISAYTTAIQDLLRLRGFTDNDVAAFIRGELTVGDLEERGFTTDDIDKLREYRDAIQDNTEAMNDLAQEIEDSFLDTLDELNDKVDDAEDRFNHFADMLEHFQNVVDIVGQDALGMSAETMELLARQAKDNAIEMVEAARTQLDSLDAVRSQAEAQLAAALEAQKNASSAEEKLRADEAVRYWSDTISEVTTRVEEAEKDLADALENALEGIRDMYTVMIEQTTRDFERSITGAAGSLEQLQNNFDRQKETQDLYIPTYEKIYELTKLTRDINNSIDNTDNLWSKQELAKLQDEINDKMADGVELTEHDVEELRKRYELKLAEAELEEAQSAKRTVRMSRDNEGNWSYVYTADEDDVAAAEQNYEDKLFQYQQMNYEYIQELQSNILQAEQDMTDAINDLDVTKFASKEAYLAEVQRIMDATMAKEQQYKDQLAQTLDQQGILYDEDWKRYNELTGYRMARDDQWVDNWDETILAQETGFDTLDEMFNELVNAIGGPDNPGSYVGDITDAYAEMQAANERALNAAGTSMQTYEQDVVNSVDNIDNAMEQTQDRVDEFSNSMTETMEGVSDFIGEWKNQYGDAVKSITEFNKDLYDSCNTLIKKLQDTFQVNADFEAAQAAAAEEALAGNNRGAVNTVANNETVYSENPEYTSPITTPWSSWKPAGASGHTRSRINQGNPETETQPHNTLNRKNINGIQEVCYCSVCGYYMGTQNITSTTNLTGGTILGGDGTRKRITMKSGGYTGTWSAASGRTGMYTGSWDGPDLEENGRLAFLHQKELVLNAGDTENFLSAIDMVRQISSMIDLQAASRSSSLGLLLPGIANKEPETLDQNVHIEAHFPNVTSHSEIEEAFTNLVGKASQFANR